MSFLFPALAVAGAALAALPIVIHLINLRRRRRVNWAAMDFLLASSRKNRTWVRLSEWLLLAARVAAVALAGVLAATPQTADLLADFFGAEPALHAVLIDDTASMGRRDAGATAWDEATDALQRLAKTAADAGDRLVIVRTTDRLSGADPVEFTDSAAGGDPSVWAATEAAASPEAGLERLAELLAATPGGRRYAYVLSDFAETAYGECPGWAEPLRSVADASSAVVLAACGDPDTPNLAIESLELAPGPVAAGVETRLVVEVANHTDEQVAAVTVALRRNGQPLTALEVGPIDPRGRRRVEAPLTLPGVGLHAVEAELPADRLPADNRRWLGVEAPANHPVVLVDDNPKGVESRVFAAALRPLGKTRSGWAPRRVAQPSADDLGDAAAVCLLDAERLTPAAVAAVRSYVESGGGLLAVLGPRVDAEWFNRAFASALAGRRGLVPWRLGPPTTAPDVPPGAPTLRVVDHPALRVLGGEQNGFLPFVRVGVRRRLAGTDDDAPTLRNVSTESTADYETLAAFPDGEPLVLESRFGDGHVIAVLTSPALGADGSPPWSNLAALPIFPVLANDLVGWLAHERLAPPVETIGDPPPAVAGDRVALRRWSAAGDLVEANGLSPAMPLAPATPGVYQRVAGGVTTPPFAAVIAASESDLQAASVAELQTRWGELARVARADDLFRDTPTPASRTPLYAAAVALLSVLGFERLLAYRNSYVAAAAPARGAGV